MKTPMVNYNKLRASGSVLFKSVCVLINIFLLSHCTTYQIYRLIGEGRDKRSDIPYPATEFIVFSDPHYYAQVIHPDGKPFYFDDIGCAILWLKRQPWHNKARIWVNDVNTKEWIDA